MLYFCSLCLSLIAINLKRAQKKIQFSLKPNCLLTRYPIFFVPGKRSPFYCFNYWNNIPYYLKEQGYEILTPQFIFFKWGSHKNNLIRMIKKYGSTQRPLHLMFDLTQINEAKFVKKLNLKEVRKVHIFTATENNISKEGLSQIEVHNIDATNLKLLPEKKDFLKIIHDKITLSPHYVSSQILGSGSHKNNLTTEPILLKHIIKIAEQDWM